MPRKKRQPDETPIDPADLAAGYMFPELFEDAPLILRSQEATEQPFQPSAAVQFTMPDLPPVDWEHIRRRQAERRHLRRRCATPPAPPIFEITATDQPTCPEADRSPAHMPADQRAEEAI